MALEGNCGSGRSGCSVLPCWDQRLADGRLHGWALTRVTVMQEDCVVVKVQNVPGAMKDEILVRNLLDRCTILIL